MEKSASVNPELLQKVYSLCFGFSEQYLGAKKTAEFMQRSYQTIKKYFRVLNKFHFVEPDHLEIEAMQLTENEVVAFAVWMQQFLRELKQFMVGLGKTDIDSLTEDIKTQLEAIGFYRYYREAQELDY